MVPLTPFMDRLRSHSSLDDSDIQALSELKYDLNSCGANQFIVRERSEHSHCHVLLSGVAISHKINGNGGRQILSISFPGELLNLESLFFEKSDQNIQALKKAQIASFHCAPLSKAMFERRNIGNALFREVLIKSSIAREWMAGKGADAATRIAHLLCEMAVRLERCSSQPPNCYELPVNQEQIAEIVAVTSLHVGRVMRTLEEEGLIKRERKKIQILDWSRLAARGDFEDAYLFLKNE